MFMTPCFSSLLCRSLVGLYKISVALNSVIAMVILMHSEVVLGQ